MESEKYISVDDLHKTYGELKAVNGISFSVTKGEVYSLLGPNGAGKTTTVEILEGIRKADKGTIKVLNEDPWHSASKLRNIVGIMPQDFRFIERISPEEAISYYCTLFNTEDRTEELLDLVELQDVRKVYFQNLSGGQKQKVGICLALINDPKVVFLDEPTTGLDPKARRKIWELIRKLKKEGRTVILTTHYLEEAQILADRVGIMDHGKMVVEGSPQEIIRKMGKGRRLHLEKSKELEEYLMNNFSNNFEVHGDDFSISVDKLDDITNILNFAQQKGVELRSLSLKEDTLEDIFVDLIEEED